MTRALALAAPALIAAVTGLTGVAAASGAGCAALGGNIQSGNVCRVYTRTPAYEMDVRFGTDYPDEGPVVDFITQKRDRFIDAAQRGSTRNVPQLLFVRSDTYRSGQPTRSIPEYKQPWHGTQSLVVRTFESMEGIPVVGTTYKTFTFDYDQNRPVTFENLFAPGTKPMDSIYRAVATEIERQQIERNYRLPPDFGRDPAHYQNFAITDDAVIFFFGTCELPGLGPDAGYFFVPVSRANLPPLQL